MASLARPHRAGEVRCSFTHSHFTLQGKSLAKKIIPWHWGMSVWRTSDGGTVKLFLLTSPVCSNVYFSAPTMCLNFSSGNLDFHKTSHIYEWLSKTVFFRERGPLLPHHLYHASWICTTVIFSHVCQIKCYKTAQSSFIQPVCLSNISQNLYHRKHDAVTAVK